MFQILWREHTMQHDENRAVSRVLDNLEERLSDLEKWTRSDEDLIKNKIKELQERIERLEGLQPTVDILVDGVKVNGPRPSKSPETL